MVIRVLFNDFFVGSAQSTFKGKPRRAARREGVEIAETAVPAKKTSTSRSGFFLELRTVKRVKRAEYENMCNARRNKRNLEGSRRRSSEPPLPPWCRAPESVLVRSELEESANDGVQEPAVHRSRWRRPRGLPRRATPRGLRPGLQARAGGLQM